MFLVEFLAEGPFGWKPYFRPGNLAETLPSVKHSLRKLERLVEDERWAPQDYKRDSSQIDPSIMEQLQN